MNFRKLLTGIFAFATLVTLAQQTGDTIVVKAFKYGSKTRDTLINFPGGNLTYEKIILKYNLRCKNALVSNQSARDQGCGEWDYSCNTFIVDSSKIETVPSTAPSHIISNFTGTVFPYRIQPIYDYYTFTQTSVTVNNILTETQHAIGNGTTPAPNVLKADERSGRTQLLFTAAELSASGLTAGNIDGFLVSVANAGGGVNFLKVGVQNTALTSLTSSLISVSGFTTVYNSNYTFTTGINRIQFYTPLVWNGTSNLLLDLSFTNTNPSNPVVLNGTSNASVMTMYSQNNYALNLSALGHVSLGTTSLSSISNEITVTFWAYGNSGMLPVNTVLLYGYAANPSQRNLNLHFPWSDNNMYFDCGYNNGFDRINKVASAAEQGGQWNHWALTKNATTGDMKIYLNGVLWHSGTGKTKPISILNLILGKDNNLNSNWKGKLNELTIWNKELTGSVISAWMNRGINNTHPAYNNLVAYYKLNEGSGLTINETAYAQTVTGVNLQWTYDRGAALTRNFTETTVRPNITFVRGTYALTSNTVLVTDSVARNPEVVQVYTIVSNATATPVIHDAVNQINTLYYYQATARKVYNGDTGALTGTLATSTQSVLTITNLNYTRRFPYYNEIMSFVTPYGIGLDMGPKGKTWYYDVTDFTPVLKGPKRLLMAMGGEFQEQMDIDFWFIVGTPPRNVLEFNQLWQGPARLSGVSIGNINNDNQFAAKTVSLMSNAQAFKLRSTITGHGAEGEFKANGGTINHFFNINGGTPEFTWQITERCGRNVIFPQGGTWVYDREGWCPGQSSLLKEYNVTPYLTAGSTATMDYGCSAPPNTSGDYRYLVANQLISYGAPNHNLDARIVDVLKPSDKVTYSRENPVCANPVILVQNTGSTSVSSLEINYWINGNASTPQTYTWTGNLGFMDTARVTLPIGALWQNGTQTNGNRFFAEIKKVNTAVDQYSFNNVYMSPFNPPFVITNSFTVEFRTNNYYLENTYVLYDDMGNTIGQSNFSGPNVTHSDGYEYDGCYRLVVEDLGNNGLSWWAASAQGTGFVRLRNASGLTVKTFEPDFGSGFEFSFVTFNPLSVNKFDFSNRLNVYPNPAKDKFTISGDNLLEADIQVTNALGQTVSMPQIQGPGGAVELDGSALPGGIYMVKVKRGSSVSVKKVMISH